MNKQTILGIVRHGLTTTGGALVARGVTDETIMTEIVGVIIAVAGLVWSIIEKKTRQGAPTDSGQPQI